MAIAPIVIGRVADRYGLITALHIPIVAQLLGAAFFVVVIQCIRRDGLHHPALARHFEGEHPHSFAPAVEMSVEVSGA